MTDEPIVHIVDDDEAVRESLSFLLQAEGIGTETYESATIFLAKSAGLQRGCVVTDMRMPGMTGLELLHKLHEIGLPLPVILITGHGDIPLAVEAMRAGAMDFIEKPFNDEHVLRAVRSAIQNEAAQLEKAHERQAIAERMASLSTREREVLNGIVAGNANKVIAFDLGISPRTVEVYRANVMSKMQAASLSELVRMALLVGDPGDSQG
jgi:two-component system response regulator FixJ